MSKSKKTTAVEEVEFKSNKRGALRDPQGLAKLSLKLGIARLNRIKVMSKPATV